MQKPAYTLTPTDPSQFTSATLQAEIRKYISEHFPAFFHCYTLTKKHGRHPGEMVWFPDIRRAAVDWGAGVLWTEAEHKEQAAERFTGDS